MPNLQELRIEGMKKTLINSEEKEPQKDLGEFEQFVKNLLQVPKEEVDEITRQDRKKQREEYPDQLEKKKPNS